MSGRRTGQITCKDGSTFEVKSRKPETKSMYGFSAKQIEGLRLLNELKTDEQSTIEDQPAAPASVKRQRVLERLGKSNRAQKQEDNVQQFLNAICNNNENNQ